MTLDNACPKPVKAPKQPRRGLPPSSSRPPRTAPPKPRNAKRQKREKIRTNGSPERDRFVRSLPCCACGIVGYSEVAHVGNEGAGAGIKANADQTAPLCGPHDAPNTVAMYEGCHRASHRGQATLERRWGVDLLECAAETERAWLAFSGGAENEEETA